MGWTDEDGSTVYYGEDDYKKARKVLDNPNSYKLLRDRLDPTLCYLGKPVMWWFDKEWEIQTDRLKAYLDIYDVSQETNIDAIMDFMPEEYTYSHHFEASGEPGTDTYCEAFTHDYRESNKEELLELWAHEKGFLGFMQDKIDVYLLNSYDLAEAKAFNRLCRSQDSEHNNNAIIAEYILTEALEPVSDSDFQAALDRLNKGLDNGTRIEQDYREEKGLLTNVEDTVQTNPDSGQESFDDFCDEYEPVTESEKVGGIGFTEWVDSKLPEKEDNPTLYWLSFLVLGPVMIPIAIVEGILEAIVEGFSGPKKKQWYQQDDDGNWYPVVENPETGLFEPGEGLS